MNQYPLLFSPLTINQLKLKNRIILPAMHLNYTPNGKITDQLIAFYAKRAQGGAGLMIAGGCAINDLAGGPIFISIKNDNDINGLALLAKTAHKYGAAMGVQLYMAGAYAHHTLIGKQAISSSPHISCYTKNEAREMSLKEIEKVQNDFASAAVRAKKAGLDMIEIIGSAGYLICQFLSPKINKRTDIYGGSLKNRMRFALETITKIRIQVGQEFCISIRISGNDFLPNSHTNNEACVFAKACVKAGIDMVNVTGGWHETLVPQITSELPAGGFSYLARGIRKAIKKNIPVAASNRINNARLAEEILAREDANLICMGRPLLADPELPLKSYKGEEDQIHYCVACNQGCFDAISKLHPVNCMVNPQAGYETKIIKQKNNIITPKLIVVVGGGVAGSMAAITSSRQGHQVILVETEKYLGGQVAWYHKTTEKTNFASILTWQKTELKKLNVDVRLETKADTTYLANLNPQNIIIATGSIPYTPSIPGINKTQVVQAWDILQNKILPQGRIVIIGGGAVGLETAINLARRGALTTEQTYYLTFFQAENPKVINRLITQSSHQITILEILPKIGHNIGRSTRWIIISKLKRFGVQIYTNVKVETIEEIGIQAIIDKQKILFPADIIVLATGTKQKNKLLPKELKALGLKVLIVGDANGAGSILKSIYQGYQAGLAV